MAEDWRVKAAIDRMYVLRYLLGMADQQGRTHGEKHHIHEVMGMVSQQIMADLGEDMGLSRNVDPIDTVTLPSGKLASEIPF